MTINGSSGLELSQIYIFDRLRSVLSSTTLRRTQQSSSPSLPTLNVLGLSPVCLTSPSFSLHPPIPPSLTHHRQNSSSAFSTTHTRQHHASGTHTRPPIMPPPHIPTDSSASSCLTVVSVLHHYHPPAVLIPAVSPRLLLSAFYYFQYSDYAVDPAVSTNPNPCRSPTCSTIPQHTSTC